MTNLADAGWGLVVVSQIHRAHNLENATSIRQALRIVAIADRGSGAGVARWSNTSRDVFGWPELMC